MDPIKNVFIDLHETKHGSADRRFGRGWENLFTDQYAFFLSADLQAATAVARRLFPGFEGSVSRVATQIVSEAGIPDFCFELTTGERLFVEHKFDARLSQTQLPRYIGLGRVALVSRGTHSIPDEVINCPNYSHPMDPPEDYYTWKHVYNALPPREHAPDGFGALRDYFRSYMRELDLAPTSITSQWRRLFEDRSLPENQTVQKDFGRLLNGVKHEFRRRGHHVENCNYFGKHVWAPGDDAGWHHIFVYPKRVPTDYMDAENCTPFDPGYEALLVDLVFEEDQMHFARPTYDALPSPVKDSLGYLWCRVKPRPVATTRTRVGLATPLVPFLAGEHDLGSRLTAAAISAMDALIEAATSAVSTRPTHEREP